MSKKKPLIVFEGIEGSGKTTLINYISRYLKTKNIKFIRIREPGGNKNSEIIRKLILNKKNNFNKLTDLMLYCAARNENIEEVWIVSHGNDGAEITNRRSHSSDWPISAMF